MDRDGTSPEWRRSSRANLRAEARMRPTSRPAPSSHPQPSRRASEHAGHPRSARHEARSPTAESDEAQHGARTRGTAPAGSAKATAASGRPSPRHKRPTMSGAARRAPASRVRSSPSKRPCIRAAGPTSRCSACDAERGLRDGRTSRRRVDRRRRRRRPGPREAATHAVPPERRAAGMKLQRRIHERRRQRKISPPSLARASAPPLNRRSALRTPARTRIAVAMGLLLAGLMFGVRGCFLRSPWATHARPKRRNRQRPSRRQTGQYPAPEQSAPPAIRAPRPRVD